MLANNLMDSQHIPSVIAFNHQSMNINQGFNQSIQYPMIQQNMNGSTCSVGFMPYSNIMTKQQNEQHMLFKNSSISTAADGNTLLNQSSSYQGASSSNDLRSSPSSSSQQQQQQTLDKGYIEHLDLSTFKIEKCKNNETHNQYRCPYYHNQNDRRRICQVSSDQCDQGDRCLKEQCPKAHNTAEVHYSKDQYKKKFCKHIKNLNNCEYGNYCSFAHSEQDILIDLIHLLEKDDDFYMFQYKTIMCPFVEEHQRDRCEYYHNTQDYRRRPDQYSYEPETCNKWPSKEKISYYERGCPDGYNCNKCHGWKELDYHPRVYKTKLCKDCKKQQNCPNYHNPQEKRRVPDTVQQKIFRLVPKNSFFLSMKRQQSGSQNNLSININGYNSSNNNSTSINMNGTSNFVGSQLQFTPQNVQQNKMLQYQNLSSHDMFINSNNIQFQNQLMNGNSIHLNNVNGNRSSKLNISNQYQQIYNDQNSNTSNFQLHPLQLTSSDYFVQSQQYQFNPLNVPKQFQVFNSQKDQHCESQVLNQFEQSNRFSESQNLQIIKESAQNSNLSSSIQQTSASNWVSNGNNNCASDDESSSPNIKNRKKSNSESEMIDQMNHLSLNSLNYQHQFSSHSQNDLNSSEKASSKKSTRSPIKDKKSLKRNSNKQIYVTKDEREDSNSLTSKNQLSDEQKFSSYNSHTNQAQLQTTTFNLFSPSDFPVDKEIDNMINE